MQVALRWSACQRLRGRSVLADVARPPHAATGRRATTRRPDAAHAERRRAPNRPSGSSAASTIRATVPTSRRTSSPPTSLPRSMSTTPNSGSTPSPRQVLHERPVARLEDVQRQHERREQHRAEREHRQRSTGARLIRRPGAGARAPRATGPPGTRTSAAASSSWTASSSPSTDRLAGRLTSKAERQRRRRRSSRRSRPGDGHLVERARLRPQPPRHRRVQEAQVERPGLAGDGEPSERRRRSGAGAVEHGRRGARTSRGSRRQARAVDDDRAPSTGKPEPREPRRPRPPRRRRSCPGRPAADGDLLQQQLGGAGCRCFRTLGHVLAQRERLDGGELDGPSGRGARPGPADDRHAPLGEAVRRGRRRRGRPGRAPAPRPASTSRVGGNCNQPSFTDSARHRSDLVLRRCTAPATTST